MSHKDSWLPCESGLLALAGSVVFLLLSATPSARAQQIPLPTVERELTGSVEVANRWRSMAGNEDLYRSMVDLGEGPKLDGFDLNYLRRPDGTGPRLVDFLNLRMSSWGGEPASALRAEWGRTDSYEVSLSYRRIAYFNTIPSFANPSSALSGATQQWLDVDRGLFDAELILRPGTRVVPFFNFSRDSGLGPGRTTFVQDGNEYAVSSNTDTYNHTFRSGVYLRFDKWNGIIEAGGSSFRDMQRVSFSGDSTGNRSALLLGQRLRLTDLNQSYEARGTDRFARIRLEGRLRDDLTVFGQFAFSQPSINVDYSQANSGDFVLFQTFSFFTGENALGVSDASWPRPSGSVGVEYRPINRLRIVESLWFDRFHVSGASKTARTLSGNTVSRVTEGGERRIESNLTRHRLDLTLTLNRRISLYGNHSYMTASALSPGSELASSETRSIDRHTVGMGVSLRPTDRMELKSDVRVMRGDEVFFRTDQRRYTRLKVQGRYRFSDALTATVSGSTWNNSNDIPDIDLEQRSREFTVDVAVTPGTDVLTALHVSYSRSTFSSDTQFLIPQTFKAGESGYQDRGHTGSLSAVMQPYARVELALGGRLYVSTDTAENGQRARPTRYYNAHARLGVELGSRISWDAGWNWYGYRNRALGGEDFRTHLMSTGFRYAF